MLRTVRLGPTICLAIVCFAGACSSDVESDPSAAPAGSVDASRLEVRPVIAVLPPDGSALAGPAEAVQGSEVTLPQVDATTGEVIATYALGPAIAAGADLVESATASTNLSGTWTVDPVLSDEGLQAFNDMAAQCFARDPACPTGQAALVVDDVVVSAPSIQTASFEADQIQIQGAFTQAEAEELAVRLDLER